jgi:hypothetical protein
MDIYEQKKVASTMARTTAIKVIRVPSMPGRGRKVGAAIRRGAGAAARQAAANKHTLFAVLAAAAVGYIKKNAVEIPKIDALGVSGTYGLLLTGAGIAMKNRTLESIGSGLISVAAFQWASGEDTISGDELSGDDAAY